MLAVTSAFCVVERVVRGPLSQFCMASYTLGVYMNILQRKNALPTRCIIKIGTVTRSGKHLISLMEKQPLSFARCKMDHGYPVTRYNMSIDFDYHFEWGPVKACNEPAQARRQLWTGLRDLPGFPDVVNARRRAQWGRGTLDQHRPCHQRPCVGGDPYLSGDRPSQRRRADHFCTNGRKSRT